MKYDWNNHRITTSTYLVNTDTKKIVEVIDIVGDIKPVFRANGNSIVILKDQPFTQDCSIEIIEEPQITVGIALRYQHLNETDGTIYAYINTLQKDGLGGLESNLCMNILKNITYLLPIERLNDDSYISQKAKDSIKALNLDSSVSLLTYQFVLHTEGSYSKTWD